MANFTARPNESLARQFRETDEQLASVFNQTWQALIDRVQLIGNICAGIEQQLSNISSAVTNIETSFSSQQTSLQNAQNLANPVLSTSFQLNSTANALNSSNSLAVSKITAANTALTNALNNLNAVSADALPYNAFLTAVAASNRLSNSMLTLNTSAAVAWRVSSGQSFTYEMASVSCRRSVGVNGGSLSPGTYSTVQINTEGFINCRNQFGLEEVDLNTNTNGLKVPCTGGNCKYYVFSLATFCGVGGGNTRVMLGSDLVTVGSAVQSIAGRANAAEDFNQASVGFGTFNVTTASPELKLEAIAQVSHPNATDASFGRAVGNSSNQELFASLLVFRRRFL